jgi:hypothetical protein
MTMHARFQSSRHPRPGYGYEYILGGYTPTTNTVVDASGTKTKGGMSDSKWSDLIGGLKDVAVSVTQTVGGIEQARLAGKSSTGGGTYQPSTGSTYQPSSSGGSGGISGTTIAIGVGVVAVLAVGGYFVFRKK